MVDSFLIVEILCKITLIGEKYKMTDTGYQIPDTRYQIPDTGYQIPDMG